MSKYLPILPRVSIDNYSKLSETFIQSIKAYIAPIKALLSSGVYQFQIAIYKASRYSLCSQQLASIAATA